MGKEIGPVVSGKFYEKDQKGLVRQIERCYKSKFGPGELPIVKGVDLDGPAGLIVPHAGYPFSGPIAAHGYGWAAKLGEPNKVIIVAPNHSGIGPDAAILEEGMWRTPLGVCKVDRELAAKILTASDLLRGKLSPFEREHSIEVQLPFLQHLWNDHFSFVPICLKNQERKVVEEVGTAIVEAADRNTLVIASTDFSHYEPQDVAEEKDQLAMKKIMKRTITGMYDVIAKHNISICGYGTVAVLVKLALEENLQPTKLKYATSGEVSGYGPEEGVVGYGAIGFG